MTLHCSHREGHTRHHDYRHDHFFFCTLSNPMEFRVTTMEKRWMHKGLCSLSFSCFYLQDPLGADPLGPVNSITHDKRIAASSTAGLQTAGLQRKATADAGLIRSRGLKFGGESWSRRLEGLPPLLQCEAAPPRPTGEASSRNLPPRLLLLVALV